MPAKNLLNHSIATQLLRVVFGLYLVVTIIVTAIQMGMEYKQMEKEIAQELTSLPTNYQQGIANAMWTYNTTLLDSILDGMHKIPSVAGVKIETKEEIIAVGSVLIKEQHTEYKNNQAINTPGKGLLATLTGTEFIITLKEDDQTHTLGVGTIYTSSEIIFDKVKYGFFLIIINSVIKTLALWFIFYYFTQKILSRPLTKLTNATRAINLDNLEQSKVKINTKRKNEISDLQDAFNDMLDNLAQSKEAIHHANKYLEDKISQRTKELELEVEQRKLAQLEAEKSSDTKSLFLANMSHEIRTPMNGIIGTLELLTHESLSEKQMQLVNVASSSGQHLLDLINDILDISKFDAGKITLENIDINLSKFICDVHSMFAIRAEDKKIEFTYHLDDAAPKWVKGDRTRIWQVLINLIGNSIKFTNKGYVRLAINLIKKTDTHATLRFDIADTGIGIKEEHRKNIFNAFEQADNTTTRQFGGTGLGLALSQRLIELMGGTIEIESTYGEGSLFHFNIDLEIADINTDTEKTENHHTADSLQGHILLVEDNTVNQFITQSMLTKLGLTSDIANNGQEALNHLAQNHYDLILMDMHMPVMDGITATTAIRALNNEKANTHIIALTANVLQEDIKKCYEAGMNDYLSKPIDLSLLNKTLEKWLSVHTSPTQKPAIND